MSEADMSPEGQQQLREMRDRLAEENAQHETIYVFRLELNLDDVLDLMRGYVNMKVKGMCELCTSDAQDQTRADRPY